MWKSWVVVVVCAAVRGAEEPLPWWRTATFYQVYPRSFMDSDGDGTGDLKGITQKANFFNEIGVDAIWMNPIFRSPMADFGYDISNYTDIEPVFGTMKDLDDLIAKLKRIGVKLVLDFVPNHTSDEHEWFQMSADPTHPLHQHYRDFYVWHDAKGTTADGQPIMPNNWMSVFGGPAWTWNAARHQFYLHQFLAKQPDLNYRNPRVVDNITEILNFWLDKGVDGFRVDAPAWIFEAANFSDEPPLPGTAGDSWFTLNHIYTANQPEVLGILTSWADLLYQRSLKEKRDIALFLEVYGPGDIVGKYYGTGQYSLQIPFNYRMVYPPNGLFTQPADIKTLVDDWMSNMPKDGVANWAMENHDNKRVPDRYGAEMVDTMNLVTGVLPGVKCVYYGEEIGMANTAISFNQSVDPWAKTLSPYLFEMWARDPGRTPMQWDNTISAGFSTNATTWLPLNPNYWWLNVAAQRAAPVSHLKVFQALTKARQDPVLQRGDLQVLALDEKTLLVIRSYNGSYYALVANLGSTVSTYTSQNLLAPHGLNMDLSVVVGSVNSGYLPGVHFKKGSMNITLRAKAAILLKSNSSQTTRLTNLLLVISLGKILLGLIC